ncbi:unnamed protein product [Choristocarpus tenellus]
MLRSRSRPIITHLSNVQSIKGRCIEVARSPGLQASKLRGQSKGFYRVGTLPSMRFMSATSNPLDDRKTEQKPPQGFIERVMGRDSCVASPAFTNRWAMVVPAFATHMCIGSPWAWSVMSGTISCELGVVTSAAGDWTMAEATFPLSIVFALQGIAAAVAGKWALEVGPRLSMAVASLCFGGGLGLGGLGVEMHSLPVLYMGYGLLAGTGVGLAYTPPVQALISWFPDKKGLASGLTIAGFGSGALVFTPLVNSLMEKFSKMPIYLGAADEVTTVVKEGRTFAETANGLVEAVSVSNMDLARLPYDLAEGLYVVGSGSTGAAAGLGICGGLYGMLMMASAFAIKTPAPGYKPAGYSPTSEGGDSTSKAPVVEKNVNPDMVLKTPQFYALSTTFFCVACGGMGLFSVAKPMMGEVFSSSLPTLVTAAFASAYVQVLAAGNLGGRIGWAAFSDRFGRKLTFNMFTLGSIPLYLAIPFTVQEVVTTGSAAPLGMFIGTTLVAITFMGGVYAILPAYEADLFGSKYVGPIHGRVMLASSAAALAGPSILLNLRARSEVQAIEELLEKVDPARFQQTFNVSMDQAPALMESKALSIGKLMEIAPSGTLDPTPFIYDSTMYTMAGLMGVAALAHSRVKPVDSKFFEGATGVDADIKAVEVDVEDLGVGAFGSAGMPPSMYSHMIPASVLPRQQ